MSNSGYIYVLEDEPNICKIGFSSNPPDQRQKDISCKYHRDFKLMGFLKCENAMKTEKIIHELLDKYRIRGEWFKLSYEEIKDILKNFYEFTCGSRIDNEYKDKWKDVSFSISPSLLKELYERMDLLNIDRDEMHYFFVFLYEYYIENEPSKKENVENLPEMVSA